jgi:hypothetical protein
MTKNDDAQGSRVKGINKFLPLHNKRRVKTYGVKIKSLALQHVRWPYFARGKFLEFVGYKAMILC